MNVLFEEGMKVPVKIWLQDKSKVEDSCLEQAYNLSKLPFVHKWVSLMPDTHAGMGMPIGGVIATDGVIIPNAVGVDIGCGMGFIGTTIKVEDIKNIQTGSGTMIQAMIGDILRSVPVGFAHHQKVQACTTLDKAKEHMSLYVSDAWLVEQIEDGYYQVGTLGGGNHFIELQVDTEGYLGIMVHSGSRNFGKKICDYFNAKAVEMNERWYSAVPSEYRLAFLPVDTIEGKQYINWMNLALDFAYENRAKILFAVKQVVSKYMDKYTQLSYEFTDEINCHHNYASLENHYNKNVWVHRKGATRVRCGEVALIPGAMGSYSYVVEGLGNPESFCSSSHGAGRKCSRTVAMKEFAVADVMNDLKANEVILGKHNKSDVAEESRFAYKDIDEVMENQRDLVKPIKRLKTVGVVKG